MKTFTAARFLAPLTLSLAAACGGSELVGGLFERITTTIVPDAIVAGGTANVVCGVLPTASQQYVDDAAFTVRLVPETGIEGGATLEGRTITATRSGTYRAFCELPALGHADAVGALLTVTAGDPLATRPIFDPNPTQVREVTQATCAGVDRFGNPADLPFPEFTGPSELTFTETTVVSETVGAYPVTCRSPTKPGLPEEPGTLIVLPGDPVALELRATPERTGYPVDARVTLSWVAFDAWGNEIPDLPGTLTAPTAPAITLLNDETHEYRLEAEGRYLFSVRLDAPWQNLTDDLELIVDITAPTITVTFPERGATLLADGNPVTVRGKVTDAGGIKSFRINNQLVTLAADGSFAHPVTSSKWGLNLLDIRATDVGDNTTVVGPTYHYSDRYVSFVDEDARGLQLPDALVVLLAQGFFDDGVHDPAKLDDLATVLELIIGSVDIAGQLDPLFAGVNQTIPLLAQQGSFDIIPGVSWVNYQLQGDLIITLKTTTDTGFGETQVDIDSRQGGLDFTLTLGDALSNAFGIGLELDARLVFSVTSQGCSPIGCLANPAGTAVGSATVTGAFSIESFLFEIATDIAKSRGQPISIDFTTFDAVVGTVHLAPIQDVVFNLTISIPGFNPFSQSFALSSLIDLDQLFGDLFDDVLTGAVNLVPQLLGPVIEAAAGPILEGVFSLLVIDTTIPLPSFFDPTKVVDLDFHTALDTVAFTDDGGTVGVAAGLYTDKDIERDPLGAIIRGDCLGEGSEGFNWTWDPTVGIGVRTDLVNSAFFAAWWGGLLNGPLDLSALGGDIPIPVDNLNVKLSWLLPPIVNDCSKSGIVAQVGDLWVELEGQILGSTISVGMYADLSLLVGFDSDEQGLSVVLGQIVDSDIEVITLDDGGLGQIFDIRALLEGLPELLGSFITGQRIGPILLPQMDLSTLVPTVPPGTQFGLGPLSVKTQDGYVVLGGDLE